MRDQLLDQSQLIFLREHRSSDTMFGFVKVRCLDIFEREEREPESVISGVCYFCFSDFFHTRYMLNHELFIDKNLCMYVL